MKGEFFVIKKYVKKYVRNIFTNNNDRILDVGSGKNPYYQKSMKGKIIRFDIKKYDKIDVIGNADFFPFRKDSFDKVIIVNSLYYFKDPLKIIENISRILKKNGKLVIITPFFYPVHDVPEDRYRFTEFGLKTILEDYFVVERIEAIGGFFNIPAVMLHSLIKGSPLMASKSLQILIRILVYLILYIPYILAQLVSILDVFDRTKRWSTYYIAVATKK